MSKSSLSQKALKNAWLAEVQAIAIYEAECRVLQASLWTAHRKTTLRLCEEILTEEKSHSASLRPFVESGTTLELEATVSRWGGTCLGALLSILPAKLSWRVHDWAEIQASEIYHLAESKISPEAPSALRMVLREAVAQERTHAERFRSLLSSIV